MEITPGLVGLVAVELFLARDRRLLANKLAPRPRDWGPYTLNACATSQFDCEPTVAERHQSWMLRPPWRTCWAASGRRATSPTLYRRWRCIACGL